MRSTIIGFGRYHYKYKSGREGNFFPLRFTPSKAGITLYITSGFSSLAPKLARLDKHKLGKSYSYTNKLTDLSLKVLKEIKLKLNYMTQNKTTKTVLLTYLSYLSLFVGSAFISGAIVHTGNISELGKYVIIGIIGISMFIGGSFVQESILNTSNLKEEGVAKFFLFSLMLSIGIGMISGGTQHFSDFPTYSSYLIPIGFILSYFAFLLKNNFRFTKNLLISGSLLILIAGLGFLGLNTYAKNLTEQTAKNKAALCTKTSFNPFLINAQASAGHDEQINCDTKTDQKIVSKPMVHDMDSMVTDDKSFLENMIPHHIEAINTSKIIIQSTKDTELKAFATAVISDQNKEVEMMKTLYKSLTKNDYKDNGLYEPMMTKMNSMMDIDLDKAYIKGMIEHHEGAIEMAKKVLPITKLSDVKILANSISTNQTKEVEKLNGWLETKFISAPAISQSISTSSSSKIMMDSDGHMNH